MASVRREILCMQRGVRLGWFHVFAVPRQGFCSVSAVPLAATSAGMADMDLPQVEPVKIYENTYIMKPTDAQR